MESFGVIVIAPLWGVISVQLFVYGVAEATCAVIYLIGFVRGKAPRSKNLTRMAQSIARSILFFVVLVAGFWLLATKVEFEWSKVEQAIYGVFAAISAMFMFGQVMGRIRKARYLSTTPNPEE